MKSQGQWVKIGPKSNRSIMATLASFCVAVISLNYIPGKKENKK